jgi:hypothetical protein
MTPDYSMMLRTAVQVQGAVFATCLDLASRCTRFLASEAAIVTRTAMQPLQTPPEQRQNAVENTVWTLYEAHQLLLRGMSGVPALSILIFLNELDRQRGPRKPTDVLGENIGGNSNPLPLLGS